MTSELQPYVGPRPFGPTESDQNRFFGRDNEADELLSRIVAHSEVLLYSQSGAGKTSLINAKLTPMLEKSAFEVLPPVSMRFAPPEEDLLKQVSNIYVFNVLRTWDETTNSAELAKLSIPDFLKSRKGAAAENETPKVAILDQFEELFTSYQERSADREDFLDQIGRALLEDRLLRVVFAMREDYIAELHPYAPLLPEKLRSRFRLERLSKEDALLAVTKPLEGTQYSFAPGVAEQLVEDLLMVPVETAKREVIKVRGDSVEPVQLQVVCQTLWNKCLKTWSGLKPSDPKIISGEQLEAYGDVDQALSAYYESAIEAIVEAGHVKEGVLRRWFEDSLITSAGTRGTVFRGEEDAARIPDAAVEELVKRHIIRPEIRGGSRWYELTHDRFIAPIKSSNRLWFRERSGGEQDPEQLESQAQNWVRGGRSQKDLISDEGKLLVAERWLESSAAADVGYSDTLLAFVQASRAARNEEKAQSGRRLKLLAAALAVLLVFSAALSIVAFRKQREAERQKEEVIRTEKEAQQLKRKAGDLEKESLQQQQAISNLRIEQAQSLAAARTEQAQELQTINQRLRHQTKRANTEARTAKDTAEKLREYFGNPAQLKIDAANELLAEANRAPTIDEAKPLLRRAVALYEDAIRDYSKLGLNTNELVARKERAEEFLGRKPVPQSSPR